MTKLLLDSGDPKEYREIAKLAKDNNAEIWGATTNPTLIAKTLKDRKLTPKEAFDLQKEIVMEILQIVPGAVSAEVYADATTKAEEMIEQGRDIATWDSRIYVKLPTTLEGFKARTALRAQNIPVNNTLVFSQEQIFAITLHEKIMRATNKIDNPWPPFISPFVGRLDDGGENGHRAEGGIEHQGDQQHGPPAEAVGQRAVEDLRPAETQQVGGDDPLAVIFGGDTQGLADDRQRRQHGVDGERIGCHHGRDENDKLLEAHVGGVRRGLGCGGRHRARLSGAHAAHAGVRQARRATGR